MNYYIKGAKSVSPIIAGIIPFGLIYGISAVSAGIPVFPSIAMSFIIFAGAGQIALVNALSSDAPVFTAVAIVALINLRMAMYGASIASHIRSRNIFKRILASYLLTDQAYAVSIAEFNTDKNTDKLQFYLGSAVFMWFTWQISTVTGVLLGKTLPEGLSLEFAVPLTFLALLGPFLKDKFFITSAAVSAGIMIIARNLPYNTGFFIAVFAGITAGILYKRGKKHV